MAIFLVTYDLKKPGQNYEPVHDYLKQYNYCKGLESVWLLDTEVPASKIRDDLSKLIDTNDETFIVRLQRDWASYGYYCADWLKDPARRW
ncbi:hypothetical protein [Sphingosinicella microcystinivorans]|uniref:hypothetical protein n=1 Tax=Sphingosinicella microcystinivorans TaxID=335406 RepID=UPI0022F38F8D|nr:hypothetical protein [Sphingosinicella microcystinivorans]WBX83547.1 hypothetical protein PE061_17380 [Sphingosinicella microcystinivorans]